MKRPVVVLLIFVFVCCCATMKKHNQAKPITKNSSSATIGESSDNTISESNELYKGMTMASVKKSWGKPLNVKNALEGLTVWVYQTNELYFVDEILIEWK